jgi:hypothetical protein
MNQNQKYPHDHSHPAKVAQARNGYNDQGKAARSPGGFSMQVRSRICRYIDFRFLLIALSA